MHNQGCFVVFEGPDGSGKSTLAKLFAQYLSDKKIDYILTREPGGNGIILSEEVRKLLLDNEHLKISAEAEAYLFAGSRAQHVNELIIPNLNLNKVVICDRFLWSSLAYQGYVRNLGIKNIYELNQLAIKNLKPDIIFYIDVDYKIGLERIQKNKRDQNRLDKDTSIHEKVIEGYKQAMITYPDYPYIILDGNQSIDDLLETIIFHFNKTYQH